jgi:hypothetical protein
MLDTIKQGATNLGAGLVRGAGSIGATLLAPIDMASDALAGKGLSLDSNRQRRADIDSGLSYLVGSDPNSLLYKTGKLGGEVAGTAGMGGVLASGARAIGASPALVSSLATSGMRAGGATGLAGLGIRAAGGAVTGATSAGLVDPADAFSGGLIGAGLPVAGKAAVASGRGITRSIVGSGVRPEVRALAQRAADLGIDIPADRIANSRPLNALASSLNYVPFSGRAATESTMQSQLNQALSRTFGQDSDNVTGALRAARGQLGDEFDRVLQQNKVQVDAPFLDALAQADQRAQAELGGDGARVIRNQIDEIMSKGATGAIDGQAAYNIKRTLDRIGNRNSPEAYYAGDLRRDLMGALNRSLPPDEAAAFATTRKQYGNMLSLEKLAQNGVDGDVSIARLANMKNIGNPDLQELADISAQFLKAREGQHGAAQRVGIGGLMTLLGGPAGLAAGVATGRATNSVLNSKSARNMLLDQVQAGGSDPGLLQLLYRSAPVLGNQ